MVRRSKSRKMDVVCGLFAYSDDHPFIIKIITDKCALLLFRDLYKFIQHIVPLVSNLLRLESEVNSAAPLEVHRQATQFISISHML